MTALGKLLALLNLVAAMAAVSWAAGLFVNRPAWYAPAPDAVDKGHTVLTFKGLQAEIDGLSKAAVGASQTWGENLEALKERERFREYRKSGYARRTAWAKTGNPNDPVDKDAPESLNKGFYAPNVIDLAVVKADLAVYKAKLPAAQKKADDAKRALDAITDPESMDLDAATEAEKLARAELAQLKGDVEELELTVRLFPLVSSLYDTRVDPVTGLPRGKPVVAIDDTPLPGVEKLLDSITKDVEKINDDNAAIVRIRKGEKELKTEKDFREPDAYTMDEQYVKLGDGQLIKYLKALELRVGKMRDIRDTVQNELFFLSTYEVNVYETRETILRREKQLRRRLLGLGITDP